MIIKNLHVKKFNTDRVLTWRLILEEYISDIEYIRGEKHIVSDAQSRFPFNGNQGSIKEPTYKQ